MRRVALLLIAAAPVLTLACDPRTDDQFATTRTTGMGIGLPQPAASPSPMPAPADPLAYPEERTAFGGPTRAGGTTGKESATSLDGHVGMGAPDGMNDPAAAARAFEAREASAKDRNAKR